MKENEIRDDLQMMICPSVISGIKAACLDLTTKKYGIAAIKVTALTATIHLIDSNSHSFKMATIVALLAAFNKVKLIKI